MRNRTLFIGFIIIASTAFGQKKLNDTLASQLDSIVASDEGYRTRLDECEKKYGMNSSQMKSIWQAMKEADSADLIKVEAILDKYGWLGPEVVGEKGSITLWMVIQHADLTTQEKYLPLMREAVKKKEANGKDFAYLEDRVALREGKRQIYGTQVTHPLNDTAYYLRPLEDPDNVDKRRAEIGLSPIAEYLKTYNIIWDSEQYKKDLPEIEAIEKSHTKQ